MIYECEKCNTALPAGVLACPECGEAFEQPVPQDADVPKRGWQPKAQKNDAPSATAIAPEAAPDSGKVVTGAIPEPYPDHVLPDDSGGMYWHSKVQQVMGGIKTAVASSSGKKLTHVPLLLGLGLLTAVLLIVVIVRPYTNAGANASVIEQHPLYPAKVAVLCHPPAESLLGRLGTEGVWPYEGQENRIMITFHPDASLGIGSTPSTPPSKSDLDQQARLVRSLFCGIRFRSGFTPDEAMNCQVYVKSVDSSEAGYDGPEVSPDRDAFVKAHLDQVEQ